MTSRRRVLTESYCDFPAFFLSGSQFLGYVRLIFVTIDGQAAYSRLVVTIIYQETF